MHLEESYPANYHATNLKRVADKITGTSSLTLISPAGFGKSHLLRFLAYNKKYKNKYKNLRNVKFIYIDLTELKMEELDNQYQNQFGLIYSPLESLERLFLKAITETIKEREPLFSTDIVLRGQELRTELNYAMQEIQRVYRNKVFYILLDGTEYFLEKNMEQLTSFLKFFRDNNKGRIEYIFTLTNLNYLESLESVRFSAMYSLLSHNIAIMKLTHFRETYRTKSTRFKKTFEELFRNKTQSFRDWQDKVTEVTGGYLPYIKLISATYPLPKNIMLTPELALSSNNLANTLSRDQFNIFIRLINNQPIEDSTDLQFLIDSGLLIENDRKLKIFSPIFESYLKSSKLT